jgi:hypothetical protein
MIPFFILLLTHKEANQHRQRKLINAGDAKRL